MMIPLIPHIESQLLVVLVFFIIIIKDRCLTYLPEPAVPAIVLLPGKIIQSQVEFCSQDLPIGFWLDVRIQLFRVDMFVIHLHPVTFQQVGFIRNIFGRPAGSEQENGQSNQAIA